MSFDCSGFICWVYTQSGVYNLPRTTAQGIYGYCKPVSPSEAQPGDLVFFENTYNFHERITHIGICVGNGKMLRAGNPIGYADITSSFWQSHFYGFGRLIDWQQKHNLTILTVRRTGRHFSCADTPP